ncbi:MAG: hypothetical protein ACREQQ_18310, partial [Candidatus Binatia bacterium]
MSHAELVEIDPAWPSVGPHSSPAERKSQWVDVEVDHSGDAASAPAAPAHVPDEAPGPSTPVSTLSFLGVDGTDKGGGLTKPPDTHLAVGTGAGSSGRVVEVTNSAVQIWDKTGSALAGPTRLATFLGIASGGFDPKVLFDQHSGRFFIVILEGTTPNPGGKSNVHIAVSTTSTPSNLTTDWTKRSGSALTMVGWFNTWCDYPGIGADGGSLFITCNLFDSGGMHRGTKIRVFDKSATTGLLAGVY